MITGVCFEPDEEILLNTFRFSVEGLDEWLSTNGFEVKLDFENQSVEIKYTCPEKDNYQIDNECNMQFVYVWTPPSLPVITEAKISQRAYIKLITKTPKPIEYFFQKYTKLLTIFVLL